MVEDTAKVIALHCVEIVRPALREEECVDTFECFRKAAKAGIEAFVQLQNRSAPSEN